MLERFFQPVPVAGATVGALGAVGHDDVRVTVRRFTGSTVRMLDHFDEPMDMRVRAKVMTVNVLVIVPMRHRPMLIGRSVLSQTAAGQHQPHQTGCRPHQQRPGLGDRLIERAGLDDGGL